MPLSRRLLAEFLGTALLLATVVGSGVMGMDLSGGNKGVALLANAGATAAMLYVLIVLFGPMSGAHMNPAVSLVMRLRGDLRSRDFAGYVLAQVAGAVAGVVMAHLMFGLDIVQPGDHVRSGVAQWLSEGVATFGLVLTILIGARQRPAAMPALVAAYIFAAYWFTASTSFANPAVTLARSMTRTFAGIRPDDVAGFVVAQLVGAVMGLLSARVLMQSQAADQPAA
ncbi:aquaporin [Lysobacter claricitrinus]|uniref:aquaporin n=1 Tax=Lysobacter claricitrinus TaxID=3367728 RepID=UPI0037DADCA2